MKKLSLLAVVAFFSIALHAQRFEDVKKYLALGQFVEAKKEVDKVMTNAKVNTKPEAFILKAAVYVGLAKDPKMSAEAATLLSEAYTSFEKYKQVEPDLKTMMDDPFYKNAPVDLYGLMFNTGYKNYQDKKWAEGLAVFQKVVPLSDMLIEKKIFEMKVDTNALILAGIMAEQAKQTDEAVKYYSRLADLRLSENQYEDIYRYLVRYYSGKKDMANFEKYKTLGKELYPKSEFFDYDKVDFALGMEEDWNKKIAALEEVIAADPNNYKANSYLGELIYDTLDSRKEGSTPPANRDELEKKMVTALLKAAEIKPENAAQLYIFLGDHYMNASQTDMDKLKAVQSDVRKRTKPGAKTAPADQQLINDAQKKYDATYDLMKDYYTKTAELFAKKGTLEKQETRQYKIVVGNLAEYYSYKREGAKGADLQKYVAEEKKWTDIESKLR